MSAIEGISWPLVIFGSCFYFVVYTLSITGNCFVLSVCYRRRASSLKWFIANLAIADLMFALLSILDIISFLWTWLGGQVSCKMQGFLIVACYTTSIMTLLAISYERSKAVVDPFNARLSDPAHASKKVISLWVISLVVGSPLLFAYRTTNDESSDKVICTNQSFGDLKRQIYYSIHTVCFFIVPLIYMIYAQTTIFLSLRSSVRVFPLQNSFATSTTNRHRKVAKTLTALTLAFVLCWSPFMIFRTLMYFYVSSEGHIWRASQLLALLNTALDPILYGIYGENLSLKQSLQRFFKCCNCTKTSSNVGIVSWTDRRNGKSTKNSSTMTRLNNSKFTYLTTGEQLAIEE